MLKLIPIVPRVIWYSRNRITKDESNKCVLRWDIPLFAGQIPGANPAIPGMFPNMFPLATSQVSFILFPSLIMRDDVFIHFTMFSFVFFKLQPFSALPVMPVQAMTQQVKDDFQLREAYLLSLLALLSLTLARLWFTKYTGYTTC